MGRSTIEFNDAADDQLAYLTKALGVKSKAEVVRNALSLYAHLVDQLETPHRALGIIAEDEGNRVEKIILVPGLYKRLKSKARPGRVQDLVGVEG